MGTLGNGVNRAYVYTKDGRTELMELRALSIEWGRELCDISRPVVTLAPSACAGTDDIHPWAHSLVIFRDDERVHEGPIRKRTDLNGLQLTSSDVLGWTERSPVRTARVLASSPVLTEALWTLTQAYGIADPNVLAHIQTVGSVGGNISRDLAAGASYHAEDLGTLVGAGLRYTVLGRSIVLWSEGTVIGTLPTLLPEKHLGVSVTITEDGDALATAVTARDDDGNSATVVGPTGADDDYYGHVGLLTSSGPGTATTASLTRYATSVQDQSYPTPLVLEIPSGSALGCDSPFTIDRLVPGVLWPVETTTSSGRVVSGDFVLSSLKVTQDARADEKVAVTLIPLTSAAS